MIFLPMDDMPGLQDPDIAVTNDESGNCGKIHFKGLAHSHATGPEEHTYELDLELYEQVNAEDVKEHRTDRTITLVIAKKEEGPHWPRLLKATGKTPQYIKADWDKWVDEDEEDEKDDPLGGMDLSALQGLGGGGGGFDLSQLGDLAGQTGDEGDDDSEDEDLPELEQESK